VLVSVYPRRDDGALARFMVRTARRQRKERKLRSIEQRGRNVERQ
jgi:hypothetical protein